GLPSAPNPAQSPYSMSSLYCSGASAAAKNRLLLSQSETCTPMWSIMRCVPPWPRALFSHVAQNHRLREAVAGVLISQASRGHLPLAPFPWERGVRLPIQFIVRVLVIVLDPVIPSTSITITRTSTASLSTISELPGKAAIECRSTCGCAVLLYASPPGNEIPGRLRDGIAGDPLRRRSVTMDAWAAWGAGTVRDGRCSFD